MEHANPVEALGRLVADEQDRIVRLWAKRLGKEVRDPEVHDAGLRGPLEQHVRELGRLLLERGAEGVALWAEGVRPHGPRRYDQRFEAQDLVREWKALGQVLLAVYTRRHGQLEPEVADLVAELVGEALAATSESWMRVVRTEEVRFREAAVMETILQHVDVGILLAGRDGALSYATPAVARLTGLPVRALVTGRGARSLDGVLAQLDARHLDGSPYRAADFPLARVLRLGGALHGEWMVIRRQPAGEEVVLEMDAVPLWEDGPGSTVAGALLTLVDRTDSAQRSRQLSEAYEQLRRVQERLLQKTRAQALGQLAGGAAHALNNFLNVLRLRVTLLRKDFKPEHLDALERALRNVEALVARLQEFSEQRAEEELADVDVDVELREAVALAREELGREGSRATLVEDLSSGGRVRLDAALLRELVVTLLTWAADRMPEGGAVTLATHRRDGEVELRVVDTGKPYAADELAALFDPLRSATFSPQKSLLLAVARSQVQRWGGQLSFESHPEGGVFQVRLPLVPAADQALPPPPAALERPAHHARPRRVLVVDDDADTAVMMAQLLADEGYEAKVAGSGTEALELWAAQRFDAALLDALMPGMSGWDLARELRTRSPHALLAMVTGADVRGMNRANLALVDSVFRKPVDMGALDQFLSNQAVAPG